MDSWLINPYFSALEGLDFMAQEGIDRLAIEVEKILTLMNDKYATYGIKEQPFVVIKADNGTYGMSVMMVHDAEEVRQLNRKQRTKMSASKGGRKVDRVIIQEGVYTFETMPNGSVAEPVVYMIGQFVVGGFYRVHQERGIDENLNAPGMHFEPLAFAQACNMPCDDLTELDESNRFYVYGVIARLAALAAARELQLLEVNNETCSVAGSFTSIETLQRYDSGYDQESTRAGLVLCCFHSRRFILQGRTCFCTRL